jgi:hypothetical protein
MHTERMTAPPRCAIEVQGLRKRYGNFVDAICELHDYRNKPQWLFTDDDESGNEDTRYRQRKGERPGLAALDATPAELTAQDCAVLARGTLPRLRWWPLP